MSRVKITKSARNHEPRSYTPSRTAGSMKLYQPFCQYTSNLYIKPTRTLGALPEPRLECICTPHELSGCGKTKCLKVMLLRWDSLDEIHIHICPCSKAARQLLRRGFFPCAPIEPNLAIDFLGYKLDNRDALRQRFGNGLEWYTSMRYVTTAKIDSIISLSRDLLPQNSTPPTTPPASPAPPSLLQMPRQRPAATPPSTPSTPSSKSASSSVPPPSSPLKRRRRPSSPSPTSLFASASVFTFETISSIISVSFAIPPEDRRRPSDYLCAQCPACFGGKWEDPAIVLAIIFAGNACFTQTRNKGKGKKDPPCQHPESLFVDETLMSEMEEFVETVRPPPKRAAKSKKTTPTAGNDEEDHYKHPEIPTLKSVLDECEASFVAAGKRRMKSSTQFFDDTALMGLNCRHDHLLFLVNMKTAGEKQYYMYALLEMPFRHLPRSFMVGFLYDIACQLERSAPKWGFLPPEYLERMQFAVSVLHAFGHSWVCQMIYHPQCRKHFGLTDGEGCEQFWHLISKLISYLRHRRIYTLDSQIHHLQKASIRRLGMWLARHWAHCQAKLRDAEAILRMCKQPMSLLRREYDKQLKAQTKPLPKRSKNAGKMAVEEVLRLRKGIAVLRARVTDLEDTITTSLDLAEIEMAERDLEDAKLKLKAAQSVRRKEEALGVDDRHVLGKLVNSAYIQARMNARTLKVERTFHRKKTDPKLKTHIEDTVKRRDPGIQEIVHHYNRLCMEMADLVKKRKAPRNAIPPNPIEPKPIWGLDVDDENWQDVGLDDESEPPLWLKSGTVRDGIKAMLEKDRCEEEHPRIFHKCRALELVTEDGNLGVVYQLQLRRHELCQLCAGWDLAMRPIPFNKEGLPAWGPSDEERLTVRIEDVVAKATDMGPEEDDQEWSSEEDEEEDDELPVEDIEAFQRGEVYAAGRQEYYASGEAGDDWGTWAEDDNWFTE
ncbi:hypothetical protein FB451DRAFT_1404244 [Mycena latifolia]|nr:hypothetical protein FB451DRAFT_1404244 [Mycena latifolia]